MSTSLPSDPAGSEPNAQTGLSIRELLNLGMGFIFIALPFAALGYFNETWIRYVALGVALIFASWGADFLLMTFPESRGRESIRALVALPAAMLAILIQVGMAISTPFVLVSLLFIFLLTLLSIIATTFAPVEPLRLGLIYLAALSAISIAAYSGDRLLIPLRWFLRLQNRPSDRAIFYEAQAALRLINFRRLAYIVAIAMYSVATFVQLTGLETIPKLQSLIDVAAVTLIGFLAVDAYIAAFHRQLIEGKPPLSFGEAQAVAGPMHHQRQPDE